MIEVFIDSKKFKYKSFNFSAGESHIKFDSLPEKANNIKIVARIKSNDDLMTLLLIKNTVDKYLAYKLYLVLPYLPYSRQDRYTGDYQPFSLKVFSKIINTLNADRVITYDVHSTKSLGLINNLVSLNQVDIIKGFEELNELLLKSDIVIVSPDKGALNKAKEIADYYDLRITNAFKNRDENCGKITGTNVLKPELIKDNDIFIPDDICDGGYTFTLLAEELKKLGANKIYLYVTHGIFSKGLSVLNENIDGIFTTNTLKDSQTIDGITVKELKL